MNGLSGKIYSDTRELLTLAPMGRAFFRQMKSDQKQMTIGYLGDMGSAYYEWRG